MPDLYVQRIGHNARTRLRRPGQHIVPSNAAYVGQNS